MRKILTLVLLLSFACSEETEFQCESCINMTISDALPIQFWKNDCQTYNEKESCGVHSFCWTQKFHCDDEIRLQVIDDTINSLILKLVNDDGVTIYVQPFIKDDVSPETEVFNLVFTPSELSPEICNGKLQLKIVDRYIPNTGNAGFDGQISYVSGIPWEYNDPNLNALVALSGGFNSTYLIYWDAILPSGSYEIDYSFFKTQNTSSANFVAYGLDASNNIVYTQAITSLIIGTTTNSFTFTPNVPISKFGIRVSVSGGGADPIVRINYVTFTEGEDVEIAKSDFVEFSDNLDCTVLAKYRNQRNFAGIDYANLPEDAYFYKRIPAVFFHEQFPGEDEQAELSDSKIIALNGVLRAQKLLDTDYMPYHEHKKNQLILKHQFVEIDGDRWTKQDAYEIAEGNKRYPLKKATCWLTNRDFVARNVI